MTTTSKQYCYSSLANTTQKGTKTTRTKQEQVLIPNSLFPQQQERNEEKKKSQAGGAQC